MGVLIYTCGFLCSWLYCKINPQSNTYSPVVRVLVLFTWFTAPTPKSAKPAVSAYVLIPRLSHHTRSAFNSCGCRFYFEWISFNPTKTSNHIPHLLLQVLLSRGYIIHSTVQTSQAYYLVLVVQTLFDFFFNFMASTLSLVFQVKIKCYRKMFACH